MVPSLSPSVSHLLLRLGTTGCTFPTSSCPGLPPPTLDCGAGHFPPAILPAALGSQTFSLIKSGRSRHPGMLPLPVTHAGSGAAWLLPGNQECGGRERTEIDCLGWGAQAGRAPTGGKARSCRLSASLCQIASPLEPQFVCLVSGSQVPYCRQGPQRTLMLWSPSPRSAGPGAGEASLPLWTVLGQGRYSQLQPGWDRGKRGAKDQERERRGKAEAETREMWDRDGERDRLASPRGSEDPEGAGSAAAPRLERHSCLRPCPWPAWEGVGSLRETERPNPLIGRGLSAMMEVSLMFGVPQGQGPGPHS